MGDFSYTIFESNIYRVGLVFEDIRVSFVICVIKGEENVLYCVIEKQTG